MCINYLPVVVSVAPLRPKCIYRVAQAPWPPPPLARSRGEVHKYDSHLDHDHPAVGASH